MGMMGAGLSMIGGLVQGMGAMQAHEAQAKAYEYNAAVSERNMGVIDDQTYAAANDQIRENRREYHSMLASMAAAGYSRTGSAYDVMLDNVRQGTTDVRRVIYKGKLMYIEEEDAKNLAEMGAAAERQAGQLAMVAGIL